MLPSLQFEADVQGMRAAEELDREHVGLWATFRKGSERTREQAREQLILVYMPLAKWCARKAVSRYPSHQFTRDDFAQMAMLGLIDSVDRFDPDRGVAFTTYASRRIMGAIVDQMRQVGEVPRSKINAAKQLENIMPVLQQRLQRSPTDAEIAAELKMSKGEFEVFKRRATIAALTSFDRRDPETEGEVYDRIANHQSPDPAKVYDAIADRQRIRDAVNARPNRNRAILALHYYHGMTLREIGEAFGVTESRISQILTGEAKRLARVVEESAQV